MSALRSVFIGTVTCPTVFSLLVFTFDFSLTSHLIEKLSFVCIYVFNVPARKTGNCVGVYCFAAVRQNLDWVDREILNYSFYLFI